MDFKGLLSNILILLISLSILEYRRLLLLNLIGLLSVRLLKNFRWSILESELLPLPFRKIMISIAKLVIFILTKPELPISHTPLIYCKI